MAVISSAVEGDSVVISLGGKIDSSNSAECERRIDELNIGSGPVFDLEALKYISSAGLRIFLRLRKLHPDLELRNASPEVYDILEMTGFTEMMKVSRALRCVSVDGCEVIGRGANGEIYRIDPDTVVKVYLNADSLPEIEHERDVARKALVLGIPTAISYDVVRVGDHYASMFEMLNAKSFSGLLAADRANLESCAREYVKLLRLIHSTEVPKGQLPDQREVTIGWIEFLHDHLPADVYERLRLLVTAIPHDDHMIHGDYHTKNIMLQNDEVMLIDMDTLAVGHPVLELASMYNAYLGFHLLNPEGVRDFLGFDHDTAAAFWKRTLQLYYDTEDEQMLQKYEDKAKTVGLIRLMRRTIRRGGDPAFIERCRAELCELAARVDSLV